MSYLYKGLEKWVLGSLWKEKHYDDRSVENNSDKRLKIEVQPAQTNRLEIRKGKAFCERPFALHR